MIAPGTDHPPRAPVFTDRLGDLGLAQASARIEAGFLAAGERLTGSSQVLERLLAAFDGLVRQHESPALAAAATELEAVADDTGIALATLDRERQQYAGLLAAVSRSERPLGDLRRTVRMIGIVAVNARVIAAHTDDADGIEVFTVDIRTLSAAAAETVAEFAARHAKVLEALTASIEQRRRFETLYRERLEALPAALKSALDRLRQWQVQSAREAGETAHLARGIAGQLGRAVMSLQIGDSTRQRLEHIDADLEDRDHPDANYVAALVTLQVAQIEATIGTFEAETASAVASIGGIADAVDRIVRSRGTAGSNGGAPSPLGAVAQMVDEAVGVLEDCATELQQSQRTIDAVNAAIVELIGYVETVRRIETEMRLVSLNAAIRCARLGDRGRALDVIAQQLRELTRETVSSASEAMAGLEQAGELMAGMGSGREASQGLDRVRERARQSLARLSGIDEEAAAAQTLLATDGSLIVRDLRAATSDLSELEDVVEALRDGQFELTARLPEEAPDFGAVAAAFSAYRSRYSMAQEREIFDRLVGTAPTTAADADQGVEDFLF